MRVYRHLLIVYIITIFMFCSQAYGQQTLTMDNYQSIQSGMTYQQVVNVIGFPGTEVSRNEMPAVSGVMPKMITVMYMWQNKDGSNMNVMFQNDKLIQKAQFGLK